MDDILTAAMKASAKSAAVVVDDAAVTPQYVRGISPARELPVVGKIALGSFLNKFLLIIPAALLLTAFAPWALPLLLVIGGAYLCYEGAHKVVEWARPGRHHGKEDGEPRDEKKLIFGAVRIDLILSSEIMLISLSNIDPEMAFWPRVAVLCVIGVGMTVAVYGAVAILVRIDDLGLKLRLSTSRGLQRFGGALVDSMPVVFTLLAVIGAVAMLWVGGHLLIVNLGELGLHFRPDALHAVADAVAGLGAVIVWIADTLVSALFGLVAGLIIVFVAERAARFFAHRKRTQHAHGSSGATSG